MQYYGHRNIIRKSTIAFMTLFNKMYIEKYRSDGTTKLFKVPIQFANREKWLQQIESKTHLAGNIDGVHNNARFEIDMIFPRISVNILNLNYDTTRKVGKMNKLYACEPCTLNELNRQSITSPAPWDIEYEMAIISKNMDDGLQIIEQIVPFFQPSLSMDIKYIDGFASASVPIILDSVVPTHDEDLDTETERYFTWLLTFRMKIQFHMPKKLTGKIQDVVMNIHPNEKGAEIDLLTQYQLNAKKLDNLNDDTNNYFALIFDRDNLSLTSYKWEDDLISKFRETYNNSEFEVAFIRDEGDLFNYDETFYLTDLAGTTTYALTPEYNIINVKTTIADGAIDAPQTLEIIEKTTGTHFNIAVNAEGDIEIA